MNVKAEIYSLQYNAYEHLRNLILSGDLQADVLYSETKMSKMLGISRTPFREAIKRLSQEGYIEVIPSKGFMLRKLNEKDIIEIVQIRCAIEGFCTHIVYENMDTDKARNLFLEMERLLERQEEIVKNKGSVNELMEYDHMFHLALVSFCDNEEFLHIFQRLMYLIRLMTNQALSVENRPEETVLEHREFFNNLKNGKQSKAYKNLVDHLNMPLKINIL